MTKRITKTILFAAVFFGIFGLANNSMADFDKTEQVFSLPYKAGFASFCGQDNYGILSHQELKKAAVDFLMPVGTKVVASRSGEIVKVITSNTKRCSDTSKCPNNEIVVKHDDGTYARYVHLKYDENPQVQVGQDVERGQFLAYSGNVGNSMMPHLHFEVYYFDENNTDEKNTYKNNTDENNKQHFLIARFVDFKSNDGVPLMGAFYISNNK
jgi:murein DD-endopeptidase MepM/ murein hydrolase activator NlpD